MPESWTTTRRRFLAASAAGLASAPLYGRGEQAAAASDPVFHPDGTIA